jgi:two-component system, NarL family, sensor kinase
VILPVLEDGIFEGNPQTLQRIDQVVRRFIIGEKIPRVKIWAETGEVLYSNDPKQIGEVFPLQAEESEMLASSGIKAELSSLDKVENTRDLGFDQLLEVYEGVTLPSGKRVLVEEYFIDREVNAQRNRLLRTLFPLILGSILLLQLVQVPLIRKLTKTISASHDDRELLLQQVIEAGDVERRQIASDLHDGVIQNLTGLSFFLAATAALAKRDHGGDRPLVESIDESGKRLRADIESLRSFVVDIYPADLGEPGGLSKSISFLLRKLETQGMHTEISQVGPDLDEKTNRLLYRVAKESLLNTERHAQAAKVEVAIVNTGDHSALHKGTQGRMAVLTITDDGKGFDMAHLNQNSRHGHLGIKALRGLVKDFGGDLALDAQPSKGTTVRVMVPVR